MYLPRPFEVDDRALLVELMRRHPFATLVGVSDGVPEITHVPLLIHDGDPLRIAGHVARPNPIARLVEAGAPLTAVFHGPHAYVSPRFYRTTPNVPTWNYVTVHARGASRLVEDHDLVREHLDAVVAAFEADASTPFRIDDVREHVERIAPGLVAFELTVETLQGKLKLNQNRRREDWEAVRTRFAESSHPDEVEMAALMTRLGRAAL